VSGEYNVLRIFVEPVDNGYEVVSQVDGKPWMRHGPYSDLDYANMICKEMVKRARVLADRLTAKTKQ
jgi:hypothetical protein